MAGVSPELLLVAAARRVFLLNTDVESPFDVSSSILPLAGLSSIQVQELLPAADRLLRFAPEPFVAWAARPSGGPGADEDNAPPAQPREPDEQEPHGDADEEGQSDAADDEALAELRLSLAAQQQQQEQQQRPPQPTTATLDDDKGAALDKAPTEAAEAPPKGRKPSRQFNVRDKAHRDAAVRFFVRLAEGYAVQLDSVARNVIKARIGSGDKRAFKFFYFPDLPIPGTDAFNIFTFAVHEATIWRLASAVPGVLRLERVEFSDHYLVLTMPAMASSLSTVIRHRRSTIARHPQDQKRPCFDYDRVVDVGAELIRIYQGLHRLGIIHRDLKPDNILGRRPDRLTADVRLCDFDVSVVVGADWFPWTPQYPGTSLFMAPECHTRHLLFLLDCAAYGQETDDAKNAAMAAAIPQFVLEKFDGGAAEVYRELERAPQPDAKSDVFAFGVTMLQLVTLRLLTSSRDPVDIAWRHWLGRRCEQRDAALRDLQLRLSARSHLSLFRCIAACLHPDPARRPSFEDLATRECFANAVAAVKGRDSETRRCSSSSASRQEGFAYGSSDEPEVQQQEPEPLGGLRGSNDGGRELLRDAGRDRDLRGRDGAELAPDLSRLRVGRGADRDSRERAHGRNERRGALAGLRRSTRLRSHDPAPTLGHGLDAGRRAPREFECGWASCSPDSDSDSGSECEGSSDSDSESQSDSYSHSDSDFEQPASAAAAVADGDDIYDEPQAIRLVKKAMEALRNFAVDYRNGINDSINRSMLLRWWGPLMLFYRFSHGSTAACTRRACDWVRSMLSDPDSLPPALALMLETVHADADTDESSSAERRTGSAYRLGKLYLRVLIDAGLMADRHDKPDWFNTVLYPTKGFVFHRYQHMRDELVAKTDAAQHETSQQRSRRRREQVND